MREYKAGKRYKYASLKLDGHFTRMEIRESEVRVFSRSGIDITDRVKWTSWYGNAVAALSHQSITFYGEMWLPGGCASDVRTAQLTHNPLLQFWVFGTDQNVGDTLERVAVTASATGQHYVPFWEVDHRNPEARLGETEGLVFSNGNMLDQAKLKPMRTADLIITGYTLGNGKYDGTIGAVKVSTLEGDEVATISGMTDVQRRSFAADLDGYLGRVVEVQYQEITTSGRLRHPVFKRLRDDKTAAGCSELQFGAHYTEGIKEVIE